MQIIDLSKGSPDWEIWKQPGISGGDIGVIRGVSPYTTPHELWEYKTKRKQRPDLSGQYQIERGNRIEPIARRKYEQLTGEMLSPVDGVHDEYPFLKAKLDGLSFDHTHGIEIKLVGKKVYYDALKRKIIPEHYRLQCLFYMLVAGLKTFDFVCCMDEDADLAIVPVKTTEEELAGVLRDALAFYQCIIDDVAPDKNESDIDDLTGNNEFNSYMLEYAQLQEEKKAIDARLKEAKERLESFAEKRSVQSEAGKVTRFWKAGSTDNAKFLKDNNLTVPDDYKKPGKWEYRITPKKGESDV